MKKYLIITSLLLPFFNIWAADVSCSSEVNIIEESIEGVSVCSVTVSSTRGIRAEQLLAEAAIKDLSSKMDEQCSLEGKFLDTNTIQYKTLTPGVMDNFDGTVSWFNSTRASASCK